MGRYDEVTVPLFEEFEVKIRVGLEQFVEFYPVDPPGEYRLYVRARGTGGKSIVRQGSISISYIEDSSPNPVPLSSLDASDDTPPAEPWVTTNVTATSRSDLLYAEWGSSDQESGIQRYEYGIGTAPEAPAGGAVVMPMVQIFGNAAQQAQWSPDVLPWTDAGGRTEVNIRGLMVA
jgi:hypothetical protein